MSTGASGTVADALFDEDHKAFRESVDTFLARRVTPHYAEWTKAGRIPRELLGTAAEDGFLGIRIPERDGGAGVEDPRFGIVATQQAMLAGAPALALTLATINDVVVPALLRDGAEEQQSRWLPALASGDALAAVAQDDGLTIAERIDGTARFVIGGLDAELLLVIGHDADGAPRAAFVEATAGGVTVTPSEPGIGLGAAGLADVTFAGAHGEPAGAEHALADLQLALAVSAVAGARAALSLAVDYVLDRKAFGQPIAQFANTRQMLGDAAANVQAGEAFLQAAIRAGLSESLPSAYAAAVKLHCTELYGAVVDTAVQLHGGYGYMMEYPIAHAYADARFWRLTGASSQAARASVADALLG